MSSITMGTLHEARELRDAGRLDESVTFYQKFLESQPDHINAQLELAKVLSLLHRHSEAATHFRNVVETTPDFAEGLRSLAECLRLLGSLDEAERYCRLAADAEPDNAMTHLILAGLLSSKEDFKNAMSEYQLALSLNPELAEAHCGIGALLANRSDLESAIEEFEITLHSRPDYFRARFGLANVLARIAARSADHGDLLRAADAYKQALKLRPDDARSLKGRGHIEFLLGNYCEAEAALRMAVQAGPCDRGSYELLAKIQLKSHRWFSAVKTMHTFLLVASSAHSKRPDAKQ